MVSPGCRSVYATPCQAVGRMSERYSQRSSEPVCGMTIDSENAAAREAHGDHFHWFCSADCARAFRSSPTRYTADETISQEMRQRTPPRTEEDGIVTPMFGSAGSGGAEYEPIPEEDETEEDETEEGEP